MTIKVLHLIDSGGLYGAEMMLLDLVEAQLMDGIQPLILSVGTDEDGKKAIEYAAEKKSLPIKAYRMEAGLNFKSILSIVKYARDEKFQILHSHGYKFNILFGLVPRCIRKLPMIATVHGYVYARRYSKMWLYQLLDRHSLRWLDCVVFVSALTEKKVNLKLKRVAVINNGINTKTCHDVAGMESEVVSKALAESTFTVGAFGRFASEKGFDVLICAFEKVVQTIPDAKLIIWGDGYLRDELESLIVEKRLANSIILPGYTEYVAYYLERIDIMAISSHTEGLPIILLEAMKYKVPVLATDVGSIAEVLERGKSGLLVLPNDAHMLAEKLIFIHQHSEEVRGMVNRAHKRVCQDYSSWLMAEQYSSVYSRVV